jgi:type IV secretion system protein VirB9
MKILKKITLLFWLFSLSINALQASQLPRYMGTEKKFRSYIFNPNEVYRYLGHYTYQGFVEFEEGETIGTITMGDPSLWLFEHLNNRLFLKPVGEDNSQTNMTVITNKRIYHFELTAKEARDINDKDLIFVAKFVYPDEKDKNILQFPRAIASDEPDLRDLSIYNFNYQFTGENSVAPLKIFDNGEFTYFQFSHKNAEVPAIFSVDSEGFESLVNFRAAGDYIIVEKVAPQFTLRNGTDIVCVYNSSMYNSGHFVNPLQAAISPKQNVVPTQLTPPTGNFYGAPKTDQNMTYPSSPILSSPQPNFPPNIPQSGQFPGAVKKSF